MDSGLAASRPLAAVAARPGMTARLFRGDSSDSVLRPGYAFVTSEGRRLAAPLVALGNVIAVRGTRTLLLALGETVARMERSAIRDSARSAKSALDFASLHPGYLLYHARLV